MASSTASLSLSPKLLCPDASSQGSACRNNPARLSVSSLFGVRLPSLSVESKSSNSIPSFSLRTVAAVTLEKPTEKYDLPTWSKFEVGKYPVFWETANGRPPASGELLTVWFNPSASNLTMNDEIGIAFDGSFNASAFICGDKPRYMTRRDRGPQCAPFFTIKINVPLYATSVIFSFSDGKNWNGPYTIDLEIPAKWRNLPSSFFNEALAAEMQDDQCDTAIFPDSVLMQDRCILPSAAEEAPSCELDLNPGCTDPESPFYDPLATVDDGSCPIDV